MRPVSAQFLAAVSSSHRAVSRVRVVPAGLNGTSPATVLAELDIVSGAVTLDSTANVRGTVDLETTATWWPTSASDPLTPYGHELFVERGVVYGNGAREWVSQGYYRINTPEQLDAPLGTITVTGSDRMQGIIDDRIPYPLSFTAGTPVTSVIQSLVTATYSWAVFDFDASVTGKTLGSDQITTDDRYQFLADMITSFGCVGYFDYRGYFVVKPPPSTVTPVATISSGRNGVLMSLSRSLSRDGINNGCVASGEALSEDVPPVSAMVVDQDPSSPTYWSGSFGHVLQFFSSSFLTTVAQCTSAAQSILAKSTGLPYSVDFGQVPNPALEPLDPVTVAYPGRRESHVLSQIVIPLDVRTAQTGQTRQLVRGNFQ